MIKIRLARGGCTHRSFYRIVVADVRAPRDGRFIEKVGTYNPNTNSGEVALKTDRLLMWLFRGAQLTDTVRNLCSAGGIMLVKHLLEGVKKGAITKAVAQERFAVWQKTVANRKKVKVTIMPSVPLGSLIDILSHPIAPSLSKKISGKQAAK